MPKVRASSGTIGTMFLPMFLSFSSAVRMRTNAIVVEISRSPVPSSIAPNAERSGTASGGAVRTRVGSEPPSEMRRSRMYFASSLSSAGL
jgi:hypothetical protein